MEQNRDSIRNKLIERYVESHPETFVNMSEKDMEDLEADIKAKCDAAASEDVLEESYAYSNMHMPGDESMQANKLDEEKAAYLFDKEEIASINKDLEEIVAKPYGDLSEEQKKFFENTDKYLEKAMMDIVNKEESPAFNIFIRRDKDGKVFIEKKVNMDASTDRVQKDREEIEQINKNLVNQKGLSKIWVVDERFGIETDRNITEDEAFKRAAQEPKDEYFESERKYKPADYRITCPLCNGNKFYKLIRFKWKCFRCKGAGVIHTDEVTYFKKMHEAQLAKIEQKRTPKIINADSMFAQGTDQLRY